MSANINDSNEIKIQETFDIKKEFKQKFVEWSISSTSHGYPNIFRTKYTPIRILWIVFLLISISICVFLLYRGVKGYLEYEVVTKTRDSNEKPALLPTVSICATNKFKSESALNLYKLIYSTYYGINITDANYNSSNILEYSFEVTSIAEAYAANPEFGDSKRKEMGFDLEKSLIYCTFNGDGCKETDFVWFYDYYYGSCYKFNSGYNSKGEQVPFKYSYRAGNFYGLSMALIFEENKNIYSYYYSYGATIFIHNSTNYPEISNGIDVNPGTSANIGIEKKITHRYPSPYSQCQDVSSFDSYFYKILNTKNNTYRQTDCLNLCLQRNIINVCGCYRLEFLQLFNAQPCLNFKQLNCSIYQYFDFFDNNTESCSTECPLECDSIEYNYKYSVADFDIQHYYINGFIKKEEKELDLNEIKKRGVAINVFYSQLRYTEITEIPNTTIIDLLANIGGTIGLFVGISVLSFVEIVEIIMEIVLIYLSRRKKSS